MNIADSFKNNLIVEERYRMILDGLQVTLLITLCAAVLAPCWAAWSVGPACIGEAGCGRRPGHTSI